ncbi:MAG: DUF3301 domain-containing protein [Rhodanobacter sp.]
MTDLSSLLVLLFLGALVGLWMKLSVAREQAVAVARRQCEQHGLQLLDETVGLRALRLCRANGLRMIERCYGFEVSVNGHDRAEGRLWMLGRSMSSVSLPVTEPATPVEPVNKPTPIYLSSDNVVSFRPREPDDSLH